MLKGLNLFFCFLLTIRCAQFNAVYGGGAPSILIQSAIETAFLNLQTFIALTTDVNIYIEWQPLGAGTIAESSANDFCSHPDSTNYPYVIIPSALYGQLVGHGACPLSSFNIHGTILVNTVQNKPFFYGISGNPSNNQLDFITVIMHEVMHILGMQSVMDSGGNEAFAPYGLFYDWWIFYGTKITGWPTTFHSPVSIPSISNPNVLIGGNLFFNGTFPNSYFKVYAPSTFAPGSSISHTDANGLMSYSLSGGEYWYVLDANLFGMMQTFGYTMTNCTLSHLNACGNCLPNFPCFPPSSTSSAFLLTSFIF